MLTVRIATIDDLDTLMQMYREAREIQLESGNLNQWPEGYPSREMVIHDIAQGILYTITNNGRIQGAFAFLQGPDATYNYIEGNWIDNQTPYCVIHRLGSFKSEHGVAQTCFDWAWQLCKNIRIDTHQDNAIMRHCLEKAGFNYCGIIYLENGAPRNAYQKLLSEDVLVGNGVGNEGRQ